MRGELFVFLFSRGLPPPCTPRWGILGVRRAQDSRNVIVPFVPLQTIQKRSIRVLERAFQVWCGSEFMSFEPSEPSESTFHVYQPDINVRELRSLIGCVEKEKEQLGGPRAGSEPFNTLSPAAMAVFRTFTLGLREFWELLGPETKTRRCRISRRIF